MFQITHNSIEASNLNNTVVALSFSKAKLAPVAAKQLKSMSKDIEKALKNSRFTGGLKQTQHVDALGHKTIDGLMFVGLGDEKTATEDTFRTAGIAAGKALAAQGVAEATFIAEGTKSVDEKTAAVAFAEGLALAMYRFDDYRTNLTDNDKGKFKKLTVLADDKSVTKEFTQLKGLMEGSELARDLVNHPANVCTPGYLAEVAKKLKKIGLDVKVMGKKELKKLGMDMMLSVAEGAAEEAKLIVLKWNGGKKGEKYKAIVGKGVTFDSGGYNIKVQMMEYMKSDMAGSAAVMGTMCALAKRKSKVNVIGVIGAVENMISATATRPSDIVKSYKGLTVEINNTDAEGRLVLGDALAWVIDKEKPSEVVDIATLTGAISIALGNRYAGLFANNDELAKKLINAGESVGEPVWRMPTDKAYHAMLKSEYADLSNIGGRTAGSCTAAAFLEEFVGDTPWAHLDIAGVAMAGKVFGASNSNGLDGANGFGVRLFVRYLEG